MCGIVGYVGKRDARPLLLESLSKLEYRGYDSCGVAVGCGGLTVYKDAVRVAELAAAAPNLPGKIGIGHTRWASCGSATPLNAHPHLDCGGDIAIVHNGNILNFLSLKTRLAGAGHQFKSETDSEVLAHLIESEYAGDLVTAVGKTIAEVEGSVALVALHRSEDRLVAARRGSPLIIGLGESETWVASDVTALLEHASRVVYLEDGDLAVIEAGKLTVTRNGQIIEPMVEAVDWLPEHAAKSGYRHFMLKEIHEQPRIMRDLTAALHPGGSHKEIVRLMEEASSLLIPACGSSFHAGMIAGRIIQELLGIPVDCRMASEFDSIPVAGLPKKLVVGLSQSGETADTLVALRRLKLAGARILAVTNVAGSSITRLSDEVILLHAGPEIAVAATKSFTAQIVALVEAALTAGHPSQRFSELFAELKGLPALTKRVLDAEPDIQDQARWLAGYENIICIGRGLHYPVALEAALKLKEVAYIHAEGCAAGELKHGLLALLSHSVPVIAFIGPGNERDAMLTSIREIKARGGPVLAVSPSDDPELEQVADRVIFVPRTDEFLQPVLSAICLQMLAYHTALALGLPIDTPRHLAKSVTVQ